MLACVNEAQYDFNCSVLMCGQYSVSLIFIDSEYTDIRNDTMCPCVIVILVQLVYLNTFMYINLHHCFLIINQKQDTF